MLKFIKSIFFLISISLYSQEKYTGEYVLNKNNFKLTFYENGKFKKLFTTYFCGVGILNEGDYSINKNKLSLTYKTITINNPKIKNVELTKTNLTSEEKSILKIKIFDKNENYGIDYIVIINGKSYNYLYNSFSNFFELQVTDQEAKIQIFSIDKKKLFYEFEINEFNEYLLTLDIDLNEVVNEEFEILKYNKNKLILRNEFGRKMILNLNNKTE